MSDDEQLIRSIYDRFNARDMEAVLAKLADDVAWANGMEGTHVHGPAAVRAYWTHQWAVIDPHVEPVRVEPAADGSMVVAVHQTVRDLAGNVLIDEMVQHAFRLDGGRVQRFDIQSDTQLTGLHSTS